MIIAFIGLAVGCVGVLLVLYATGFLGQLYSDWRRKRAHVGKVQCQGEDVERIYGDERNRVGSNKIAHACKNKATRVTPNGYFCEEHWESNSRRYGLYAGVAYGHKLQYTMTGRRAS